MPLRQVPQMGRVMRRPQHTFALRQTPYTIQPFLLAPVIPGETMKNLMMQARVVTDPIKNPLMGWWIEYYFFYVKHRDLDERDDLTEMMLDPNWDPAPVDDAAAVVKEYFAGAGINWTKLCLKRVVTEYFRNDGELWDDYVLDGLPIASLQAGGNSWMDSLFPAAEYIADDVSIPVDAAPAPDVVKASEVEKGLRMWETLRMGNLTTLSYEEWLATYGIRTPEVELHKPELVRFVREWSYPSNTVNPATGVPASAVSWSVAERADKDRFFREPGFLFGVSVARPKVYLSAQKGSASWLLRDAFAWLPATHRQDPASSIRLVAQATGPIPSLTDAGGYYVDVRDLFLYGDQFCNFDMTGGSAPDGYGLVPLPAVDAQRRFIESLDDIKDLFVTGATAFHVRQDGIVTLGIAGTQVDHTPTTTVVA